MKYLQSLKGVLVITLTLLAALFVMQNTTVIEIRFLFWSFAMSRALLVLALLVTGFVLGLLVSGFLSTRHKPQP